MRTILITAIGLICLLVAGSSAQPPSDFRAFRAAVAAYVDLHHRAARALPPQSDRTDAQGGLEYATELRRAIGALRPVAKEGSVFGLDSDGFRRAIRYALRAHGIEARELIAEMVDDLEPGAVPPVVNEPFSWRLGNVMLPTLLAALPPLPDELEYRLVGADLVLVDVPAGLVVDILRRALAMSTTFDTVAQHRQP
jgi:hypothetical protein